MQFEIEIGEQEKHKIVFKHDRFHGTIGFHVDGKQVPAVPSNSIPQSSFSLESVFAIFIGDREKHDVRVQVIRPLMLAGF